MGTRVLQLLMVVLLTGCVAWASAIFFGPWALTKYLEGQTEGKVELFGLRVTPKLAVTASRVQMLDVGAVIGSFRGVEVNWRLFSGDEPAVVFSITSGGFVGSLIVEELIVTVTRNQNGDPLKISGTAAKVVDPNLLSAADVKFHAYADYGFQFLRRVQAITGDLTTQYALYATASNAQIVVDQIDFVSDLLQQDFSGTVALTNLLAKELDLATPRADVKFAAVDGLVDLEVGARDIRSETVGVGISGFTGSIEYDTARSRLAAPIGLDLDDIAWGNIQLPTADATVTLGEKQFKVSVKGTSLGSEVTLGRRFIGRAPDASFTAKFDASSLGGNLQIYGEARLAAAQQPVELDVSFRGTVADVNQPVACVEVACEISDIIYEYSLNVAGETLRGSSKCMEPTCSSGARTHDLSTTDTNKFFANLQGINLISPLVLGGAYAQILQGIAVGAGHKINF